ncbi:phosphoribosylaminoimidazole carboxylase ATPase subunit [Streptococcus pneumoniae]|nr:phosphoribosylaminoimidazole carboxylase ATPase subunit [Streptococcus pneumoniae]
MIQIIVNTFIEKDKTGAVVEVLYASADQDKVQAKYEELAAQYPENYLAIYNVPLECTAGYGFEYTRSLPVCVYWKRGV